MLSETAKKSRRRRQHQNLHVSYSDPCQRLFNAIEPDSFIRPHRHGPEQGIETIVAIRGLMALVVFDEVGGVDQVVYFGDTNHQLWAGVAVGAEIYPGTWHTVVAIEHSSILLELKAGPFNPDSPKFPAVWAPEEGSAAAVAYLQKLRLFLENQFRATDAQPPQ